MSIFTSLAYWLLFLRFTFALIFAFSFVAKARRPFELEQTINKFNILKPPFTRPAAWFILALEFVIPLLLLGNYLLIGFFLALILLGLFSAAVATIRSRGTVVSCNCFGPQTALVSTWTLGRNGALMLAAVLGIWLTTTLDIATHSPSFIEVAIAVPLALLSTLLATNLETFKEILFAK